MNCGPREILIYSGHISLTLNGSTLSVDTTDAATVGTHSVSLVAQLANYPDYNPVVAVLLYFEVHIDAACH